MGDSGKGRPPLYSVILNVLDARDVYSPASIADFVATHGLIDVLHPEPGLDLAFKKNRTRIALGRHTAIREFPQNGDAYIQFKGRWFAAWHGWRWQGAAGLDAALAAGEHTFKPLWSLLEPSQNYDLARVCNSCRRLRTPVPPKVFESREDGSRMWGELHYRSMVMLLTRRALYSGLDPAVAYPLERWQAKPPERAYGLLELPMIGHRLERERIYTVADLLELAFQYGLFHGLGTLERLALRSALYRFARTRRFPEGGDQLTSKTLEPQVPGWFGWRWRSAIFGDDFLALAPDS